MKKKVTTLGYIFLKTTHKYTSYNKPQSIWTKPDRCKREIYSSVIIVGRFQLSLLSVTDRKHNQNISKDIKKTQKYKPT